MPERTINISFPIKENILLSVKETKAEFTKKVLFLSALYFYKKRRLSLGKAAELVGCNKLDFIERLQQEGECIFEYDDEEMNEIFDDAESIR